MESNMEEGNSFISTIGNMKGNGEMVSKMVMGN
jgi:hypothetical protein